nr:vegetative cell wall protein gp1-like [Aegilops tauschii subsp. strangulata]
MASSKACRFQVSDEVGWTNLYNMYCFRSFCLAIYVARLKIGSGLPPWPSPGAASPAPTLVLAPPSPLPRRLPSPRRPRPRPRRPPPPHRSKLEPPRRPCSDAVALDIAASSSTAPPRPRRSTTSRRPKLLSAPPPSSPTTTSPDAFVASSPASPPPLRRLLPCVASSPCSSPRPLPLPYGSREHLPLLLSPLPPSPDLTAAVCVRPCSPRPRVSLTATFPVRPVYARRTQGMPWLRPRLPVAVLLPPPVSATTLPPRRGHLVAEDTSPTESRRHPQRTRPRPLPATALLHRRPWPRPPCYAGMPSRGHGLALDGRLQPRPRTAPVRPLGLPLSH